MNGYGIIEAIIDVLVPALSAMAGWFVGRRKRKNDFLVDLQKSIDLLSAKNKELVEQLMAMQDTIVHMRRENTELKEQVQALRKENAELSEEVGKLSEQLANVKTITKVRV